MDENQFPTVHLGVFPGGIVSGHIQRDFVLVAQIGHGDVVDKFDLAQGEEGLPILPVMKVEVDLLGEIALQGDEIESITVDDD